METRVSVSDTNVVSKLIVFLISLQCLSPGGRGNFHMLSTRGCATN